jgi:hypothetical protein
MKHVVEAGTDAGSLLLFDPDVLPQDFGSERRDAMEVLAQLHAAGTVLWTDTGGDGGFLLHAYVNEDPPADVRPFLHDPAVVVSLPVPSGRVYFAGAEYAFRDDDTALRRYPHMGGSFAVPPGTYQLTLYWTGFPDGSDDAEFRRRASPAGVRLHAVFNALAAITVVTVVAAILALFAMKWRTWLSTAVPAVAAEVVLLTSIRRSPVFRSAEAIWQQVQREFPSFIAVLEQRRQAETTP